MSCSKVEAGLYRDCERTQSFLALGQIRPSIVESRHDSRESCLSYLDPSIPAQKESLYFAFQHGSGFRRQTDGSGDGQQHGHADRHGFAKGGLQTFNKAGRNLIEPQTRLGRVTLAAAAPFEVVMSTATRCERP